MKQFKREHYLLKAYEQEQYRMDIENDETHIDTTEYNEKWEPLYMKAKKLAKEGKKCLIWELKYSFE